MRMWMVNPKIMCRQHLLGEHRELHMLLGTLQKKRSLKGYLDRNIMEPLAICRRHNELVEEMVQRGYTHNSPLLIHTISLNYLGDSKFTKVNQVESYREITRRCERCKKRYETFFGHTQI